VTERSAALGFRFEVILAAALLAATACGGGSGGDDGGSGPDADSDADSDSDLDADTDTDPGDLAYQWHTFFGAAGSIDFGAAAAVDGEGNVYVTGYVQDSWDGPEGQDPLHEFDIDSEDAFVLKLDPDGGYLWHTFFGGPADDSAFAIALSGDGTLYVAGLSDETWDGPEGQEPVSPHSGGKDLMVLGLDGDGAYLWHTFHGSGDFTWGAAVAVDGNGDLVVAGSSLGEFCGPGGEPPLHAHSGGEGCYSYLEDYHCADAFALGLGPDGAYRWHTFHGAKDADDFCHALAVDDEGNAYVTGYSYGSWDGPGGEGPLSGHSGDEDAFVLCLDAGGGYAWHAYFGAEDHDGGYSVAIDPEGDVVVAGKSRSPWNGPGGEPPLHAFSGDGICDELEDCPADLFVLALDEDGAYRWHTFHGSTEEDFGSCLTIDGAGDVFVTGASDGAWNGPAGQDPLPAFSYGSGDLGDRNTLVLALDAEGAYRWHGFFPADYALGLAVGGTGSLHVAGWSRGACDGPEGQIPLHEIAGDDSQNVFVVKLTGS
jgi:hypothetical protein